MTHEQFLRVIQNRISNFGFCYSSKLLTSSKNDIFILNSDCKQVPKAFEWTQVMVKIKMSCKKEQKISFRKKLKGNLPEIPASWEDY